MGEPDETTEESSAPPEEHDTDGSGDGQPRPGARFVAGRPVEGDGPEADSDDEDGDDEDGPGREISPLEAGMLPKPPKRTGVFVDADDLRTHVGDLLRAMLGGYQVDAWGNYTFTHEGARIFVTTSPSQIGPQVGVFSITNLDLDLTPQLAAFLVTNNHRMGFGSFSYDPDTQSVWLRHTLLGTTLDGPELQAAVMAVATTAAHVDDVIRDRFGGRAFHDAPEDVQSKARPPEPEGPPGRGDRPPNASGYL